MTLPPPDETRTLIDELLAEQQQLTAVEQFSRRHEQHELPAQARYYRELIPLGKPRPGEQYSFSVDLDSCSGCKACVSACHSLNGLDEDETWRGTGLLHGGTAAQPYQQTVTTACHHCVDPACLNGCPVLAYEKDADTGIVRHLDDQCIGCQYCVLKCPYDVPKYSASRGIVRKCDMCHDRLAVGEAPACVQACPHEAIRIEIVVKDVVLIETSLPSDRLLPGAFESNYTHPTTRYKSSKPIPASARPADADALRLESPHWPLVFMLVLTQLAGGLHLLHALLFTAGWSEPLPVMAMMAMCALLSGLTASVAHLGRPLKAWRSFLGWRRSWMSREIIAFSVYAGLAALLVWRPGEAWIAQITSVAALIGIACSMMIYVDTRRPEWSAPIVFTKFFGTTLLLGATAGAVWAGWLATNLAPVLAAAATVIRTILFGWEWTMLMRGRNDPASPVHRAALTAICHLRPVLVARGVLFGVSTMFSVMAIFDVAELGRFWALIALVTTLTSQVLERYTFFAACPAPRMPGGVHA